MVVSEKKGRTRKERRGERRGGAQERRGERKVKEYPRYQRSDVECE